MKSENTGNESSLDIAMINDNPNEQSVPINNEFADLDAVLNFESKEYT